MQSKRKLPTASRTALIAGILASCWSVSAVGAEVNIDENAVKSLAGSPFVTSFRGQLDEAGRPSISLDLIFTNQCLLETGISATIYNTASGGTPFVILQQIIPSDGCPDIASPSNQKMRLLLPGSTVETGIYLVSKPWRAGRSNLFANPLRFTTNASGVHDIVVEAQEANNAKLVRMAVESISMRSGAGYTLHTKIALGKCTLRDIETSVFEIPDSDGTPVADIVLVVAPDHCGNSQVDTNLDINVIVPDRGFARTVTAINEEIPTVRPIK